MRVLVLGGTGFIGPHVVRYLREHDTDVTLFNRGQRTADLPDGVHFIRGDRTNLAAHAAELRAAKPDVVLDMRPLVEDDAIAATSMFAGHAGRLVAISSADVYLAFGRLVGTDPGEPLGGLLTDESPLREHLYPYRREERHAADDPQRWQDDYDKILVERVVMGSPELPGTILRLPMVHGPLDNQHRAFPIVKRIDDGRRRFVMSRPQAGWRTCRGHVGNVAAAIGLAILDDRAANTIFNVADETIQTDREWTEEIARTMGVEIEVVVREDAELPESLRPGFAVPQNIAMDSSRIRQRLGYREPLSREEALRSTIAWEREHPPTEFDAAMFDYAAEDSLLLTQ
jgi:nucleoside-diphosphate-sugar epimerase